MPHQLRFGESADHAIDELAPVVEKEGRRPVDALQRGDPVILIDVQQDNFHPTRIDRRQLVDDRSESPAVTAPGREEFDHHRPLEAEDLTVERVVRCVDGSVGKESGRRQPGLASTAHGLVVAPSGRRDPVPGAAAGTANDDVSSVHKRNIGVPQRGVNDENATAARGADGEGLNASPILAALPGENRQALVVAPCSRGPVWAARVGFMEAHGRIWRLILGPFPAVAGRNGFALPGEKREGDGKTPSGIFAVEHAFGCAGSVSTALPYRQIEEDDVWVNDPLSDYYNRSMKRGEVRAFSFEEMMRPDNLYRYGMVIGYNRNPAVKGLGSAIFVHVWKGCDSPTSGCVALAEEHVVAILGRLDPSLGPSR